MNRRVVLVPIFLITLAGGAAAQTQPPAAPKPAAPPSATPPATSKPATPPSAPPQAAPKPLPPPAPPPAPVSQLQSEFAVAVGDSVMFPYQSKDLTLRSLKILDNQAKWLIAKPEVKVTLEAYCDDDIEQAKAQEFCLSRAREVRDYLVKQGVMSERISLVAFDDTQAPRTGAKPESKKGKKDDKNRRTNRRVSTRVSM
jgi:peptidoglycan-associated lipoprotein